MKFPAFFFQLFPLEAPYLRLLNISISAFGSSYPGSWIRYFPGNLKDSDVSFFLGVFKLSIPVFWGFYWRSSQEQQTRNLLFSIYSLGPRPWCHHLHHDPFSFCRCNSLTCASSLSISAFFFGGKRFIPCFNVSCLLLYIYKHCPPHTRRQGNEKETRRRRRGKK